jgi:DNA-binding NtrC family response regulator
VRIVAATNVDLEARVVSGDFREDLYYRLNILAVHLPPLRDRPGDVPLLAKHFLASIVAPGEQPRELTKAAEAALSRYHWPGNVRELENCIMASVALAHEGVIRAEDLALPRDARSAGPTLRDESSLAAVERRHIALALARLDWNKALAAHRLGIDRATLYRKMKRYGLGKTR